MPLVSVSPLSQQAETPRSGSLPSSSLKPHFLGSSLGGPLASVPSDLHGLVNMYSLPGVEGMARQA